MWPSFILRMYGAKTKVEEHVILRSWHFGRRYNENWPLLEFCSLLAMLTFDGHMNKSCFFLTVEFYYCQVPYQNNRLWLKYTAVFRRKPLCNSGQFSFFFFGGQLFNSVLALFSSAFIIPLPIVKLKKLLHSKYFFILFKLK